MKWWNKYIKIICSATSLAFWTNYWNYFNYTAVYCCPAYDTPDVREQQPAWQQLIISRKIVMDVKCSTDVLATWRGSRGWYQSITEWRGLVTNFRRKEKCGLRRHAPLVIFWTETRTEFYISLNSLVFACVYLKLANSALTVTTFRHSLANKVDIKLPVKSENLLLKLFFLRSFEIYRSKPSSNEMLHNDPHYA